MVRGAGIVTTDVYQMPEMLSSRAQRDINLRLEGSGADPGGGGSWGAADPPLFRMGNRALANRTASFFCRRPSEPKRSASER